MIGAGSSLPGRQAFAQTLPQKLSDEDIAYLPAFQQNALIAQKKLTALELAKIYISRREEVDLKHGLNSFISYDKTTILKNAALIDSKLKSTSAVPSMAGLFAVATDVLEFKALPLTAGTELLNHSPSLQNAFCLELFVQNLGLVAAKTNLDEFTFGVFGQNEFYGQVKNPFDLKRSPGGSSAGTAVAVASGLCSFGIGSDASGSVRIPAAVCGLFGFKPTKGAISSSGLISFVPFKDSVGVMARSAKDITAVFESLCKEDRADRFSGVVSQVTSAKVKSITSRVKIAALDDYVTLSDKATQKSFQMAIADLAKMNVSIEHRKFDLISLLNEAGRIINFVEQKANIEALMKDKLPDRKLSEISSKLQGSTKRYLEEAKVMSTERYQKASSLDRERIEKRVDALFKDFDFLLTPTTGAYSPTLNYLKSPAKNRRAFSEQFKSPCELAGFLGLPAITVPLSQNETGLPVGLQLIGRKFSDFSLLQFAQTLDGNVARYSRPKFI